tara:strand:+ start:158 stop:625 length:468 start_codon:yes stop_codon:yes gene_type:complete
MFLFVAFIAVPILEITLFLTIGSWLGVLATLSIVIITAALGAYLVRMQGLATLSKLQKRIQNFENPNEPLAHGAMILFAGALLLTPGFFTDAIGFLLLTNRFRNFVFKIFRRYVFYKTFNVQDVENFKNQSYSRASKNDKIIEGEYWENETKKPK